MIEFLVELVTQVLGEVLLEYVADRVDWQGWNSSVVATLGHLLIGILLGAATLLILPHHVIGSTSGRVAALIGVPLGLGALFALIETARTSATAQRLRRFFTAAALGFGFALVRYLFAH
jgi:hypothetical protein